VSSARTNVLLPAAERRLAEEEPSGLATVQTSAIAPGDPGNPTVLPTVLQRASAEILGVLGSLQQSRSTLEQATVEKLQHTPQQLREVISAAEVAATDILDALDRAEKMLNELDEETDGQSARSIAIRGTLREEIFGMMGALQFQDITTQQLRYASGVLVEMEQRLTEIARLFDAQAVPEPGAVAALFGTRDPAPSDLETTTSDGNRRQALADAIFVRIAR
jgi:hypothetical protein